MAVNATTHITGADIEFGTFTIDPASIASNAEGETTVTIAGADTTDLIFVNPVSLAADLVCKGARVSAANTVAVNITTVDAASAVDATTTTFQYMLVKVA